ncbi:MAG: type II toxin-antitoxin system PemK/MazF family toxin [Ornithinimicrobium sp.]
MANRALSTALSLARSVIREIATTQQRSRRSASRRRNPRGERPRSGHDGAGHGSRGYAGDYRGSPPMTYAPIADDLPDPGEVVWTWVPYEEDHGQGKDRPVLVIGRSEGLLLALQLTSQDHDRDAEDEARYGRYWIDVGAGEWDRERRPSEARVDRVLQLDPGAVRRIGAVLPEPVFARVAEEVRRRSGR